MNSCVEVFDGNVNTTSVWTVACTQSFIVSSASHIIVLRSIKKLVLYLCILFGLGYTVYWQWTYEKMNNA